MLLQQQEDSVAKGLFVGKGEDEFCDSEYPESLWPEIDLLLNHDLDDMDDQDVSIVDDSVFDSLVGGDFKISCVPEDSSSPQDLAFAVKSSSRKRSSSKRKARNRSNNGEPARPLSAYNLFFRDYRRYLIRKSGGSVPFAVMGKEVGKKWKSLTREQRQVWEQKADIDSDRYRKEIKIHKAAKRQRLRRQVSATIDVSTSRVTASSSSSSTASAEDEEVLSIVQSSTPYRSTPTVNLSYTPPPRRISYSGVSRSSPPEAPKAVVSPNPYGAESRAAAAAAAESTGAREIHGFPPGFSFPDGLPPSGSTISQALPDGNVQHHTVQWRVYSVKKSDAGSFLEHLKASVSHAPLPTIAEHQQEDASRHPQAYVTTRHPQHQEYHHQQQPAHHQQPQQPPFFPSWRATG